MGKAHIHGTTAAPAKLTSDLTRCDQEPIHVPGAIQPHGALLVLDEPDLTITQASENAGEHLGQPLERVLDQPLSAVLGEASAAEVRAALDGDRWKELNPLSIAARGRRFDGIVHRHAGATILELEPILPAATEATVHHPLRRALLRVQSAGTLGELYEVVVHEVRRLTGFERVMLYQFDDEGHGAVIAEARGPSLEPYLGLHYPASDIPRQARALYLANPLRIIPDARYTPARLVPGARRERAAPLDLSFAVLRSVSPVHLEYMANMGVLASMSVSLRVHDGLWGLISCANHSGPRRLPYELRSACEVLGLLTSLEIAAFEDREAAARRDARRLPLSLLVDAMRSGDDVLEGLLARPAELLALVGAEGAAVVRAGDARTWGRTPPLPFVMALADWLDQRPDASLFSTASLAAMLPSALPVKDVASGLLSFGLPGAEHRRLLWFRPEIVQTVRWGGDPREPVETDPHMRIHPRRSFALWKQEMRLRSRPFSASDIEAAEDLRRYAVEIDLERQVERAQRAVRARDDLVAVVSHDLKNPIGVIQMQAALLLRAAGPHDEPQSRRLRALAERIQRSVDRMNALVHGLLDLAKIESGRFVLERRPEPTRELVEEALLAMRPLAESRRITIAEHVVETPRVEADRERIFQVFSNLLGNAIKFTPEGGAVTVEVALERDGVRFTVADTGPGIPADRLPHVFERYWRAPGERSAGAGLGLYIAHGIVEAHGGRLWVESTVGVGTRFMFTLPLSS
ncbi:histidine kinase [Sorangium cellulosum]|uniref:histidine kinase n=1 Tax=Sorangium cellulosum TaxID=56 RepID=A0A4P2PT44_SORCE|nr:ATP-binding protein [Sorangium cellulosum]AUX19690.1 histidine kinase [Sorangium cellulosum]